MTAPTNDRAATLQHAAGDAHAWDACAGCGAAAGEQCWMRATRWSPLLGQVPARTNTHKARPCAGRTWRPR